MSMYTYGIYISTYVQYVHEYTSFERYGVATISRLLKITGLFYRISSLLYGSFAKETYHYKKSSTGSHPISQLPLYESVHVFIQKILMYIYAIYICIYICYIYLRMYDMFMFLNIHVLYGYGVATVSRIDKIIGLFCRMSFLV